MPVCPSVNRRLAWMTSGFWDTHHSPGVAWGVGWGTSSWGWVHPKPPRTEQWSRWPLDPGGRKNKRAVAKGDSSGGQKWRQLVSRQPDEAGLVIPILKVGKLRLREVEHLAQKPRIMLDALPPQYLVYHQALSSNSKISLDLSHVSPSPPPP